MNKEKKRILFITIGAVGIILLILLIIIFVGREKKEDIATIGLVMSGAMDENGWNGTHYRGVKGACDNYGANLLVKENVKEFTGECKNAIRELIDEGAGMIILSSYGYSKEVKELVKEFPETVFYVNSSEYHDTNMTSYFARMYQARYLAGIVAGLKTESGKIGYVAAMANNEVNRGINAFTLGVKSVNRDAEVIVTWSGEWDYREKETELANILIEEEKVDVLTYHQNQSNVIDVAEQAGIYSIGYHEVLENQSPNYLTSVMCNWELVYAEIIREFFVGKGNLKDNYWIGLEADAVGLSAFSEEVSKEIEEAVENAKTRILDGKDVFSGTIYDIQGNLKCDEKEIIADEVLLEHIDWYVEGVRIYEE